MPRKLDVEVMKLCGAINKCAGLRTYSSCAGHGAKPFEVWFKADSVTAMFPLLRAIDPRYGGPDGFDTGVAIGPWKVEAYCTDLVGSDSVTFCLSSRSLGDVAYAEADKIASNLLGILADDKLLAHFRLGNGVL